MTDKKSSKPVTLEDYIPPEPEPAPRRKSRAQRDLSGAERDRLEALERTIDEDKPKPKKKHSVWTAVFWIIAIIVIANWLD